MPVDDHPIHPTTQKGSDFRYGCNNSKEKASGYYAPDRVYRPDGTFHIVQTLIKSEWIKYDSCPAYHDHIGCTDCVNK